MAILERVIKLPLHQYARYFSKYSTYSVTRPVDELIDSETKGSLLEEMKKEEGGSMAESVDGPPETSTNASQVN